jgi:FtsP/CotA-like multicopper oxidase with cupredoxin domain
MQRRPVKRLLLLLTAFIGAVVVGLLAAVGALYAYADASNIGELRFENKLKIPPLLEPRQEDGRQVFDLKLQTGTSRLLPGKPAETWGVNGPYLGPTLRASRGDDVVVRVRNELPEATTVHWHGMHLPATADGGPHQPITPGATWAPSWTIAQPAATLWYHAHPHGQAADHVYRGLAGLFIVDDPDSAKLALPDDYGVDDIPVIIQDKRLRDDGSLDFSQSFMSPTGRLGDTILINGTHDPHVEIRDERVRLRLLNASNARVYSIGFSDVRAFELIATDAGLLEAPQQLTRLQLSPGERAEIVTTFEPGENVVLRSFEPDLGTNFFEGRFAGADDSFDLLQIRAASMLTPSARVPARLAETNDLDERDAARTRRFELNGTSINGKDMDPGRVDLAVEANTTEIWEVHNVSGSPHNFHPHGVSFRVIEYGGEAPPPHLSGWKDTVYVAPGETARLLVRFGGYSDPDHPYMFHCHVLQHEDRGMMGQFIIVER